MKLILLSAGDDLSVYSVPNDVADNLAEYCVQFGRWVAHSPEAERFRIKRGDFVDLDYTEQDFIDYLNDHVCGTRSVFSQGRRPAVRIGRAWDLPDGKCRLRRPDGCEPSLQHAYGFPNVGTALCRPHRACMGFA